MYSLWVNQVCVSSQRFLQRFIDPTSQEDENASLDLNEPLYMQKLDEVGLVRSFGSIRNFT